MSALGLALLVTVIGGLALLLMALAVSDALRAVRLAGRIRGLSLRPGAGRPARFGAVDPKAPLFATNAQGAPWLQWLRSRVMFLPKVEEWITTSGVPVGPVRLLRLVGLGAACFVILLLMAGTRPLFALTLGVTAAVYTAYAYVRAAFARRRRLCMKQLPDALGLMVRGLRAGMPVIECVGEVSNELPDPLASLFRRAFNQVRLGQPLEHALEAETRYLNMDEMNFLIVTLSIQRETGGNLAETLSRLDGMMRRRTQMRMKIRALSSEARSSALIIASLPIVIASLMFFVAPSYLEPLFTTTAGHVLLGISVLSLSVGGWVMAQMIRIEQA